MVSKTLSARLRRLEIGRADGTRRLPVVLRDDAPQAQLDRMREGGIEAYRFAEAVDLFVVRTAEAPHAPKSPLHIVKQRAD
jgi:hypothetical protein